MHIEESLNILMGNSIDFENVILKNKIRLKIEQKLYYITKKYLKRGYFDILKEISEHVTMI